MALLGHKKSSTIWGFAKRPRSAPFFKFAQNGPAPQTSRKILTILHILAIFNFYAVWLVGFPRPHVRLRSRLGWPSTPSVYLISLVGYLISRGGSRKWRQSFPPTSAVRSRPENPPNCSQTLRAPPYKGGGIHTRPPAPLRETRSRGTRRRGIYKGGNSMNDSGPAYFINTPRFKRFRND